MIKGGGVTYALQQVSDGKIIRKEDTIYKLLITATDKNGCRFTKKSAENVHVGDIVFKERFVSGIYQYGYSDRQTASSKLNQTYKKTLPVRIAFRVVMA